MKKILRKAKIRIEKEQNIGVCGALANSGGYHLSTDFCKMFDDNGKNRPRTFLWEIGRANKLERLIALDLFEIIMEEENEQN